MKNIILFLVCFVLGFILFVAFTKLTPYHPKILNDITSAKKVAFNTDQAPTEALKIDILSFSGEVWWEARSATTSSKLTHEIKTLQQGEKLSTREGGKITVQIADIFKANVSANSEINVIQTLPESILLDQTSGSAEYIKFGQVTFSIKALHLLLQPSEGDFTLTVDKDKLQLTGQVKNGVLKIAFVNLAGETKVVTINAGESFSFDDQERKLSTK